MRVLVQSEGDGCAHVPGVDADGTTEFFGRILHLAETIGGTAVKVDTGIPHSDHGAITQSQGFHMDALVLGAIHGLVQQVPQYESQQIFIGADFEIPVYLIDYDRFLLSLSMD